jgi:pimeloyl-ACP methyl ester carboxylesterase
MKQERSRVQIPSCLPRKSRGWSELATPFFLLQFWKISGGASRVAGQNQDNILVLADGRRLGYASYGDPKGWPLLFFHGTPGSRVMARFAAPKARELGVRLIAPERPGFGLSDVQPQRMLLDWGEDVEALANHLHLRRFALAGVSGGGPYVLACAWKMGPRIAVAGVISGLAPVDRVRRDLSRSQRLAAALVSRVPLGNLVLGLLARSIRRRPDLIIRAMGLVADRRERKILSQPEVRRTQIDGIIEAFRQGTQGTASELALGCRPWGFEVGEIQVPIHLWHGEADAMVPVGMGRYLAAHLPRCRARFIPGVGHLWIFEGYEEIFRELRERAEEQT